MGNSLQIPVSDSCLQVFKHIPLGNPQSLKEQRPLFPQDFISSSSRRSKILFEELFKNPGSHTSPKEPKVFG